MCGSLVHRDSGLTLRSGALLVLRGDDVVRTVPLHHVREVHLYGAASLTSEARNLLLREGVDAVFLSADGRYRGRLVGVASQGAAVRLAWYGLVADPARRLEVARRMASGKLQTQRQILAARRRGDVREAVGRIDTAAAALGDAADLDTVRGLEGSAAVAYFAGFGGLIRNPAFPWSGRNRRPPRDPVNACLSYGYTLLVIACENAARQAGLDVALACLHEHGRGGPVLAFDLAEELRPAIDALVLTLLNRRELKPDDFRTPTDFDSLDDQKLEGAVYLGKTGRAILLRAFERRMTEVEDHALGRGAWPLRGLLLEQARQLAAVALGEQATYLPIRLGG
jgi:CRISPR-associated protein Cas1